LAHPVYDCAIAGAGASGLLAAARILSSRPSLKVVIIDPNSRCGKKLMLTGAGRCNFTNSNLDLASYNTDDPAKLSRALGKFGYSDTIDFFENVLGVLTTNKGDLYYPATLRAGTVVDALRYYIEEKGCEELFETKVTGISKDNDLYKISLDNGHTISSRNVIVATGGITYPKTGSTGDVEYLLNDIISRKDFTPFKCSLVSLITDDPSLKTLAGVRIPATVTMETEDGIKQASGELQITKDGGLSGILIFDLSGRIVKLIGSGVNPVIHVNFCNAEPGECCLMAAVRTKMFPDRAISAALSGIVQRTVLEYVLKKCGYKCTLPAKDVFYNDLCRIADALTAYPFTITGYGKPQDAQISSGGVNLSSLDDNMMLRSSEGLYIVGEAVNVDGICGGYNLQWAWTSASLAAEKICK